MSCRKVGANVQRVLDEIIESIDMRARSCRRTVTALIECKRRDSARSQFVREGSIAPGMLCKTVKDDERRSGRVGK